MTFSDTVAQQREQQEKNLKRFITYSLAGSFALHGIGLCLQVNPLWKPNQLQPEDVAPEDIAIVVAEPSDKESAEVIPEENFSESTAESTAESEFSAANGGAEESNTTTLVAPSPTPSASGSDTPVAEPVAEDEPQPESTSAPIVEDSEESVEERAEETLAAPDEDIAEATEPRNLSNLLEDLRNAREQARPPATRSHNINRQPELDSSPESGGSTGNGAGADDRNSTTAVGATESGSGSGSESSRTEGGNGTGEGNDTEENNGTAAGQRPGQGSQSREITCQGCDFDYPESADGAEGTAQVMVETDEQGQVVSVTLSGSSGNPELDRAALEQARERVRLQGARAGESYPIDIDFVQPNSEAAERAEERGDRRSITVSEPESAPDPVASEAPETPSPETRSPALEQPLEQLEQPPEPAVTATPSVAPESSPSSPSGSEQIDNPELDVPPPPEATDLLNLEPELIPESTLDPDSEPEFAPEPLPEAAAPEPLPEAELTPAPEPEFAPVPTPEE